MGCQDKVSQKQGFIYVLLLFLLCSSTLAYLEEIDLNASNPSYTLLYGEANATSMFDFDIYYDVSENLSDSNINTGSYIYIGEPFIAGNLQFGYNMNLFGTENTVAYNDVYINTYPSVAYGVNANEFSGMQYSSSPQHTTIGLEGDYNVESNPFTFCMMIDPDDSPTTRYVGGVGARNSAGFRIIQLSADSLRCEYRDSVNYVIQTTPSGNYDDGGEHFICCMRDNANFYMYVDGSMLYNDSYPTMGSLDSGDYIFTIGTTSDLYSAGAWYGLVDYIGLWDRRLLESELDNIYDSKSLYNKTTGISLNLFFNYTYSLSSEHQYLLSLRSDTTYRTPIMVYYSENMTHINQTSYINFSLNSGTNYIPVDSIIKNNTNYPFRVVSLEGDPLYVQEAYLTYSYNDTTPPTISNPRVDDDNLSCTDSGAFFVDATDDSAVSEVIMYFSGGITPTGIRQSLNKYNDTTWFYNWSSIEIQSIFDSLNWSYNSTLNVSLINATATDVVGQTDTIFGGAWVLYSCIIECVEDWQATYTSCTINDTYIKYYVDGNSCGTFDDLPIDNGTIESCNYCSENISVTYLSNCTYDPSGDYMEYGYTDDNYYTCCAITGIISDCSVLYTPYNTTHNESCIMLSHDFLLEADTSSMFDFGFGGLHSDKMSGKIYLNGTDMNETYYCISYVKTVNGSVVQTNPSYTMRTDSALWQREYEDREFFETQNGIANVYWTSDNLVIDGRIYIFGVECSGTDHLISEQYVSTEYANINEPITRTIWVSKNILGIILTFFIAAIVILLLSMLFQLWGER